jgi:hypothetical protein
MGAAIAAQARTGDGLVTVTQRTGTPGAMSPQSWELQHGGAQNEPMVPKETHRPEAHAEPSVHSL